MAAPPPSSSTSRENQGQWSASSQLCLTMSQGWDCPPCHCWGHWLGTTLPGVCWCGTELLLLWRSDLVSVGVLWGAHPQLRQGQPPLQGLLVT